MIEYYCGILELDYQLYENGYQYVSAKRTSDKISKDTKVVGKMVGRGHRLSPQSKRFDHGWMGGGDWRLVT